MKETQYPLSSRSHPKHGDPEEVILFCWSEAQIERWSLCRASNRSWDTKPWGRAGSLPWMPTVYYPETASLWSPTTQLVCHGGTSAAHMGKGTCGPFQIFLFYILWMCLLAWHQLYHLTFPWPHNWGHFCTEHSPLCLQNIGFFWGKPCSGPVGKERELRRHSWRWL